MKQTQRLLLVFLLFVTVAAKAQETVIIGTQTWMVKNLDVTTYRDGTAIPQVTDPAAWGALTTGGWCYYNNDPANGILYGKLYNWYAVNDPRGLAPAGFHVPSDGEWTTLSTTLGGLSVAGGKMKSTGTTLWTSPNAGADNSSGWAGLPGGFRDYYGPWFSMVGNGGCWWSTAEAAVSDAWCRTLSCWYGNMGRFTHKKKDGVPVRCLAD